MIKLTIFDLDRVLVEAKHIHFDTLNQSLSEIVSNYVITEAEKAIGTVDFNLTPKQLKGKDFSRALYVIEDINIRDEFNENNVKSIRPGYGLHPKYYEKILGIKSTSNMKKGYSFNFKF